jgi:sugar lactone lactonase YvrE
MNRSVAAVLLVFVACTTAPPPPPPTTTAAPAAPASAPSPLEAAIPQLEAAIAADPKRTPLVYVLAIYHDRLGHAAETIRTLEMLEQRGWTLGLSEFDFQSKTPEFLAIKQRLDARQPRVARAQQAFTITGHRDLIPEGIAYDPVDDVFYVSSLYRRKVLRVQRDGSAIDFVPEGQDGILATLGLHVDPMRRLLWVATATSPEMHGYTPEMQGQGGIYAYDLRDGKLVKRITKPALNDIALLPDGTVFGTATFNNTIHRLAPGGDAMEVFLEDFRYPNGITVNGTDLYVADFRGITRIDLRDQSRHPLVATDPLAGIDGLVFHNGTLLAIQNAVGNSRVIRIHLADNNRIEVLEAGNPLFHLPTTGVVAGDSYFFVANSMLRAFDDGKIWPDERLREPVMLRVPL